MSKRNIMTLRFLVLMLCGVMFGATSQAAQIRSLLTVAGAVVIATESSPLQSGQILTFQLDVERVLAGPLPQGATVTAFWKQRFPIDLPQDTTPIRGIWFLQQSNGIWQCIPAASSGNAEFFPELSLPVASDGLPPSLAYESATTPISDQIVLELAGGTTASNARIFRSVAMEMTTPGALRAFRSLAARGTSERLSG
jgi:hypothetical protein